MRPRHRAALALSLMLLAPRPARAQTTSIADWKLVCFCNSRVRTPHFVVQMDNNGAILYAARAGTTRQDLGRLGIAVTHSQLRLLEDWELLAVRGDSLQTTIPILGPESTALLRKELRTLAGATLTRLRPSFDSVVHLLGPSTDRAAAFAVVFSYLLDGLVWDSLAPGGELVPTDITVQHPFWHGAFWAISSERPNAPGTNSARLDDSTAMLITWTPGTLAAEERLNTRNTGTGLAGAIRRHDPALVPAELRPYGFVSADGKLRVTTIDERGRDPFPLAARALAGVIARDFKAWLGHSDLPGRLGLHDPGLATLIFYHEHMWDLLDGLVSAGVLEKPAVIGAATASPADVRALFTVILRSGAP